MIAQYDKVIVLRDDNSNIIGMVIHDMASRHQVFYSVSEMGADEVQALLTKENPIVPNEDR